MADSRRRAVSQTLRVGPCACACCILSSRRRVAFFWHSICQCVFVLLLPRSQYVPHPMPHVPLLASWRSLSWSSNCEALLEIIHIIRCEKIVFYQVELCVFYQEQIGRGHVYIEYTRNTRKVLKLLLLSTPKKYCAGKMRIHFFFSGQVLFV